MKSFMEEYGRILVSAIVILVLVASANGIGGGIKDGMTATVDSFTAKMEELTNKIPGEGGSGGAGEEATTFAAGIYNTDGSLYMSWEDLMNQDYVTIDNGGVCFSCNDWEYECAEGKFEGMTFVIDNSITSVTNATVSCNCTSTLVGFSKLVIPESVTYIELYEDYGMDTIYFSGTAEAVDDNWVDYVTVKEYSEAAELFQ